MNYISEEFKKSGLKFDKTTQPLSALPFEYDSLKIQGNSFVTHYNFNNTIKKIYYNLMFLYRASNIANFKVFEKNFYSLKTITNLPYLSSIPYSDINLNIGNNIFFNSIGGAILNSSYGFERNFLISANKDRLYVFEVGEINSNLLFSTNQVDPISGDVAFKNIVDIKYDNIESLYVVDADYKNIYQYYLSPSSLRENLTKNKLLIKNFIGGYGDVDNKIKFKSIKNICINKKILVAQDPEGKCFKVFDKNLNWLHTCVFYKFFEKYISFDSIMVDNDNNLYCGKGTQLFKFEWNEGRGYIDYNVFDIKDYFKSDEYIVNLFPAYYESLVAYVVTNKSIKKIWLTTLDYVIGEYNYDNNNIDKQIKWVTSCPADPNRDVLLINSVNDGKENISVFLDSLYIDTLLKEDFVIYDLEDILIKDNEYVQSFNVLKNLKKMYYSLFLFLKNIKYRYKESGGAFYPVIGEKVISERFISFSDKIDYEINFDIGINEVFQSEVINRSIKEIVDFQKIMLLYIINNITDNVYYSPDPGRYNPLVKNYLYFTDESLNLVPNPIRLDIFGTIAPGGGILTSLGGAPYDGIDGISIEEGVNI